MLNKGRSSLLGGALVWNRIDDAVRWTIHELRRLCPEAEFGTRSMAQILWLRFAVAVILDGFSRQLLCLRDYRRTPRARDRLGPQIEIRRRHYHGDPRLPVIEISVRLAA